MPPKAVVESHPAFNRTKKAEPNMAADETAGPAAVGPQLPPDTRRRRMQLDSAVDRPGETAERRGLIASWKSQSSTDVRCSKGTSS